MPEELLANHGLCTMDLDLKKKLINTQRERTDNTENFHPHIINNTDTNFSNDELLLLNTGLKYFKKKKIKLNLKKLKKQKKKN
jgi:hypothetical protein